MAGMNLIETLKILTPRMTTLAAVYSLRAAVRTVRSMHPDRRGLAFWQDVRAEMTRPARPPLPPCDSLPRTSSFQHLEQTDDGSILIRTSRSTLKFQPLSSNLVLLRARQDDNFPQPFSYGVAKSPEMFEPAPVSITQTDAAIRISLERCAFEVDKETGQLALLDPDGWVLFQGRGIGWSDQGQIGWQARFDPDSAFYGLGEKTSELNLAGKRFELWNTDPGGYDRGDDPIYMSIPFFVALHDGTAIGLFFDNSHRSFLDMEANEPGVVEYRAVDGEFRLYVMVGTPAEVLSTYTEITGRMSLPPLWVLGFHQSRWSYYPQQRVLEVAEEFRRRKLPCDVIHLDIHYMDDYRCFTWDGQRFPQPRLMIARLHEQGFKVLSMIDPGIKVDSGYHVYDEGRENGCFIAYPDGVPFTGPVWPGDCHFPDFTNPQVRQWWGDLYRPLLEDGIDAFWNDMNEIALIIQNQRNRWVPDIVRHDMEGRGASHARIHNVYGLQMVRASREGLDHLHPDRRTFILSRSGWAGLQRYAAHWTGDNKSTWDHLRLSLSMVLNLGYSGVAFTGPDLGGFTGGPSPELYARWLQAAVFVPFMRAHSMISSPDHEPWAFGEEVEAINRQYLELRYRLLPYLYTAVWQAAQTGVPIMRAMSFAYPDDTATYSLDDQFMCGDNLLVAPVLEEGAQEREVYLPAGTWIDWWTGEAHTGPVTLTVKTPLDRLPLFVQGGAIIPLWPVQQYVGEKNIDVLTLRVFTAPGGEPGVLYEDDGESPTADRTEDRRLSRFAVLTGESAGTMTIQREIVSGSYHPGYRQVRLEIFGLAAEPHVVTLDEGQVLNSAWVEGQFIVDIDATGPFELSLS